MKMPAFPSGKLAAAVVRFTIFLTVALFAVAGKRERRALSAAVTRADSHHGARKLACNAT